MIIYPFLSNSSIFFFLTEIICYERNNGMATIDSIKQRIEQLDSGSFQVLCDAYLSREGYPNPVSLGTKAGTHKTTQGTPDTYFCLPNGKYVLAEYTTQRPALVGKIRSDLEKCFDLQIAGISNLEISEIIYCHTSSSINVETDRELKQYCEEKGIQLTIIGIDKLAGDINRKYPTLAKEHLNLNIDSEQILNPLDYVKQYDASALAAPLKTKFQFRTKEIERLQQDFDKNDVVILSGAAGSGKTKLALEFAERYKKEHFSEVYVIHDHGLPIFDDLKQYFERPDNYFVIIDDANQLSQLNLIVEYANKKDDGYNVKILVTVRNYALQKVRTDLNGIVQYSEVTLNTLSDNEIKSLVEEHFGIVNQDYLNRIVTIADGNARIALIAGKVAINTQRLQSISDVTDLYEVFYGKAFKEADLDGDIQLQITAGVISFLGSVHLDHITEVLSLLAEQGIDLSVFKSCSYKLHEMELVDICRDKAVAISDQCFSNYILKYVFVEKKTIKLSQMIESCFSISRGRTIQAINTLLHIFQNQDVHDYIIQEINALWNKLKIESSPKFWDYVKAFYQINPVETLMLIKGRIDNTIKVNLSFDELGLDKCDFFQSENDDIINILGGYADTENIDSALDLFFEYFLKKPDLYSQFSYAIDQFFGIKPDSIKNGFFTQVHLIQHFNKYSEKWNNPFIRTLFFETANNLLQLSFSPAETDRKEKKVVFYRFSLSSSEQAVMYRRLIWEQLLVIQATKESKEPIRNLLRNYARSLEESSYELVREESPYICQLFLKTFSPEILSDCILAENVNSILDLVGYSSKEVDSFLTSRKLRIYHILVGPNWGSGKSVTDLENEHKRKILDFILHADSSSSAFNELYEVHNEYIACDRIHRYEVEKGFLEVIKLLSSDKDTFFEIVNKIIDSKTIPDIHISYVVSTLFSFVSPDEVKSYIYKAPEEKLDSWLYAFYSEIPSEAVDNSKVEGLYEYLRSDYDKKNQAIGIRSLSFLNKYKAIDPEIFIKVARLVFAKKDYSPSIVNAYFYLSFNRFHIEPKIIIHNCANDHELLEEIYLFVCTYNSFIDFDGSFLKELCCIRKEFARDYSKIVLMDSHQRIDKEKRKLHSLFDCPEYIEIIDMIVDEGSNAPFPSLNCPSLMEAFVNVPNDLKPKSDAWIKHYIKKNNANTEMMVSLFSIISELCDDKKVEYICHLVSFNSDLELFKKIPLHPTSYSWSGSAVPLFSKWIDYLNRLLPHFSGLSFLPHKAVIVEHIEYLKKEIERFEIEDLLRG